MSMMRTSVSSSGETSSRTLSEMMYNVTTSRQPVESRLDDSAQQLAARRAPAAARARSSGRAARAPRAARAAPRVQHGREVETVRARVDDHRGRVAEHRGTAIAASANTTSAAAKPAKERNATTSSATNEQRAPPGAIGRAGRRGPRPRARDRRARLRDRAQQRSAVDLRGGDASTWSFHSSRSIRAGGARACAFFVPHNLPAEPSIPIYCGTTASDHASACVPREGAIVRRGWRRARNPAAASLDEEVSLLSAVDAVNDSRERGGRAGRRAGRRAPRRPRHGRPRGRDQRGGARARGARPGGGGARGRRGRGRAVEPTTARRRPPDAGGGDTLGFEVHNYYTETTKRPMGQEYPWLDRYKLAEPHRESWLRATGTLAGGSDDARRADDGEYTLKWFFEDWVHRRGRAAHLHVQQHRPVQARRSRP